MIHIALEKFKGSEQESSSVVPRTETMPNRIRSNANMHRSILLSTAVLLALQCLAARVAPAKDLKLAVEVWGANKYDMLGTTESTAPYDCDPNIPFLIACTPVRLSGLPNIVAISTQNLSWYTLALTTQGTLWSWGLNISGQLGHGTDGTVELPGPVIGLTQVIAFSTAGTHSLAVKSDGTVLAWGENGSGQLGDGTVSRKDAPVQVHGMSRAARVSGDSDTSFALRNDGTVWAWGVVGAWPSGGTCEPDAFGNPPDPACHYLPVRLAGLDHVVSMSGRIFLKSDGTVWQVSDPNNTPTGTLYSIVQVTGLSGVAAVIDGVDHGLALRWDGTVWAWGRNDVGQLGNGTTIDSAAPVQVHGLKNIVSISDDLALQWDGTAWAWGGNDFGQLGDGTTTQRTVPVKVKGAGPGTLGIAANGVYSAAIKLVWE